MGKTLKIMLLTLIVWSLTQIPVQATSIGDVLIEPENPTSLDMITIVSSGMANRGGFCIDQIAFVRDGYLLELFLNFDFAEIGTCALTPWEHSEEIGSLLPGDYHLVVQTTRGPPLYYDDMYVTDFTVVPEPAT